MSNPLSTKQVTGFQENGYLLLENALSGEQLAALRADFDGWVEESRRHTESWGELMDGRSRFDLEPGHSAKSPALRRVGSPTEVSSACLDAMRNAPALDAVAQLFSPNIKFNHSKINSKLPGAATRVKYHQDWPYEVFSNDDLVTVLYFLDEVDAENGPLEVVPGSHRGPLYSLWHDGVFTGAVAGEAEEQMRKAAITCTGPAGSACLMHARLVHGSQANRSQRPRTLFIACYCTEDAMPLIKNPVPSIHEGEIVRGVRTGRVRATEFDVELPEHPEEASFFNQQARIREDS